MSGPSGIKAEATPLLPFVCWLFLWLWNQIYIIRLCGIGIGTLRSISFVDVSLNIYHNKDEDANDVSPWTSLRQNLLLNFLPWTRAVNERVRTASKYMTKTECQRFCGSLGELIDETRIPTLPKLPFSLLKVIFSRNILFGVINNTNSNAETLVHSTCAVPFELVHFTVFLLLPFFFGLYVCSQAVTSERGCGHTLSQGHHVQRLFWGHLCVYSWFDVTEKLKRTMEREEPPSLTCCSSSSHFMRAWTRVTLPSRPRI